MNNSSCLMQPCLTHCSGIASSGANLVVRGLDMEARLSCLGLSLEDVVLEGDKEYIKLKLSTEVAQPQDMADSIVQFEGERVLPSGRVGLVKQRPDKGHTLAAAAAVFRVCCCHRWACGRAHAAPLT